MPPAVKRAKTVALDEVKSTATNTVYSETSIQSTTATAVNINNSNTSFADIVRGSPPKVPTTTIQSTATAVDNNSSMLDATIPWEEGEPNSNDTLDPVQFMNDSEMIVQQLSSSSNDNLPIFLEDNDNIANLPSYTKVDAQPNTSYNTVPPDLFVTNINNIYEEMVKWRKNLFLLPTGNAGKSFVNLITQWVSNYNKSNTFQSIVMKVVMILPNLLLQKPSSKSKAKDHSKALEERLKQWNEGKFMELLRDCKIIQKKLTVPPQRNNDL